MLFYIIYKLGYLIANILPLRIAYCIAERCSDIQYYIAKKDREAVLENLSKVLNKKPEECLVLARKVYRNFGLYLVDFFRIPQIDKEFIKRHVRFEGIENLDGVLRQNRGVVALSCHIGSWEMGGVIIALMGYDISVVALKHRYESINKFFIGQREKKGVKVITISSVMKRCVSALLNKGMLALLGDRDFANSGITLDFFNMPTNIPKGPALLSLKTNSLIVPVFFIREGRFNHRCIIDEPIEVREIPGATEDEVIKKATERFIPVMEKYIKRYPTQWLLFRRFWETPVDASVI